MAAADFQSGATPQHAVAADFNRDGHMDLAVANAFDDSVRIHLSNGDGTFTEASSILVGIEPIHPRNFPRYLQAVDVNRDGVPDLVVLCSGSVFFGTPPSVQTLINKGDGTLAALPAVEVGTVGESDEFAVQFTMRDIDGDGYADAVVANLRGEFISVLSGDGTGSFAEVQQLPSVLSGAGPQQVLTSDLDRDGLAEVWSVTAEGLLLHRQSAPGVFLPATVVTLPVAGVDLRAAVLGDFDGDGTQDLALADAANRVIILESIAADGSWAGSRTLTDPSLNEAAGIAVLNRDGDWVPDLAVSNRSGNSVTIFKSSGGVDVLATALQPRRLFVADLTGSGRGDLVTINEGDLSDPMNHDISILVTPPAPDSGADYTESNTDHYTIEFGPRLQRPHAASMPSSGKVWVVDQDSDSIHEFTPDMTLNANPSASVGTTHEFGFVVAGITMANPTQGYVLERWSPVIRRFNNSGTITDTINFSEAPGELGFSGLTRIGSGDFLVGRLSDGTVFRVSSAGATVSSFTTAPAAWDLAWDATRSVVLASNPGRRDVRAWELTGTLRADYSFTLGGATAWEGLTVSGISPGKNSSSLSLLTPRGLVLDTALDGSISGVSSVSNAVEVRALSYAPGEGQVLILGNDHYVARADYPTFDSPRRLDLAPAIAADSSFVPAGVTFRASGEEVIVSDANRPVIARLRFGNGQLLGFEDYSATLTGHQVTGGAALDPVTGHLWFRTELGVVRSDGAESFPLPHSENGDITAYDGVIVASALNAADGVMLDTATGLSELVVIPRSGFGGLVQLDADTLLHLEPGTDTPLRTLTFAPASSVWDWSVFAE